VLLNLTFKFLNYLGWRIVLQSRTEGSIDEINAFEEPKCLVLFFSHQLICHDVVTRQVRLHHNGCYYRRRAA